jgi:hypothetical protein
MGFNSTIRDKIGICSQCPPDAPPKKLIAGLCASYHYPLKIKLKSRDKIMERDAEKKNELDIWYDARAAQILMKPYDWEDGTWIAPQDYRNATAHVLPKSLFPSIATHPMNWLLLSPRTGAHSKYDSDWVSAQLMKVWPIAVERFKILYPHISKEERRRIPECLLKEIK